MKGRGGGGDRKTRVPWLTELMMWSFYKLRTRISCTGYGNHGDKATRSVPMQWSSSGDLFYILINDSFSGSMQQFLPWFLLMAPCRV
jgi:hypothetical protein